MADKQPRKEEWEKRRERIRMLALLCLENRPLTDDELKQISEVQEDVSHYLYDRWMYSASIVQREIAARKRRKKLEELPTEELERMLKHCRDIRSQALADDVDDEGPDSLYEAPPFDSEEYILDEILKERRAKPTKA